MTGDDIHQRLDRIESIQEITKLKHTYWHYNDTGLRGAEIASLFTEDGVWSNEELGHYVGRKAIREFFDGLSEDLPFCAHVGMNEIIELDGDRATARWRCLLPGTFVEDEERVSRLVLIDYADEFARIDGRWYIEKLDIVFNFDVEVRPGWAGAERIRPSAGASRHEARA